MTWGLPGCLTRKGMVDGIPGRGDDVSGKCSCPVICLLNLEENFGW